MECSLVDKIIYSIMTTVLAISKILAFFSSVNHDHNAQNSPMDSFSPNPVHKRTLSEVLIKENNLHG